MNETRTPDDLVDRVAESVRHALRLVGGAENGIEHDTVDVEEDAVS